MVKSITEQYMKWSQRTFLGQEQYANCLTIFQKINLDSP